jgi:hypothetical protein
MDGSSARFRDLKGIGPATEARLHEAGIHTWDALAVAATALAAVRGDGESRRDVASAIAARRAEEEVEGAASSAAGERLESFLLRVALDADDAPEGCEVTHARTTAVGTWPGWRPRELVEFIEEHLEVRRGPVPADEPVGHGPRPTPSVRRRHDVRRTSPSSDHLVVLDAGKAIGGASRDISLVVVDGRAADGEFGYRATLAARALGQAARSDAWRMVGSRAGRGSAPGEVALAFPEVQLPPGIHRLELRMQMKLPTPTTRAPALTLG